MLDCTLLWRPVDLFNNAELRQTIQAAQNKCEGFNNFAQWA